MKRSSLLFCVSLLFAVTVQAQLLPDSVIRRYNRNTPQEKLYVHFDNAIYTPGQTVWYKIYLQSSLSTSDLSRNVYIDWYNDKGRIIAKNTSPVNRATSWGNFEIPASYTGKRLYAVAYTQWMLNFDSAFLFRKELAVMQTRPNADEITAAEPSLHFFPEGGDMIEGLSSVIAFKTLRADGSPGKTTGIILNKEGKQVTSFATVHDGMGKLNFTPLAGEKYSAEWIDETGKTRNVSLPAAKKSGIVLSVEDGSLDRNFKLSWSPDIPAKNQRFQVVAHSNQKLLFKAIAEIKDKKNIVGVLPLVRFPSGVITLTILNEAGQPLAERILFVNNEEYRVDVTISFDSVGLQKREKNVFDIDIPDSLAANLSLAVTAGELTSDSSENIITSLLLSSELKGHVHEPAYYFSSAEDSVKQQLDLVMLTNGWRRFKWEDAAANKKPVLPYTKEDLFLSLTGTVKLNSGSQNDLKKAKTLNLIFQAKDSSRSYALAPFNDNSWFEYNNLLLFDTIQVFYQLNGIDTRGRTTVTPTTSLMPFDWKQSLPVSQPGFVNDYMAKSLSVPSNYIGPFAQGTTLEEVTVRTKTKSKTRVEELNDEYTTGMFKSGDAYQLNMVDDNRVTPSTNLITYIQSKVPGIRVENQNGTVWLRWRGNNSFASPTGGDLVAVLINEIAVTANELLNINATDIAYIKVFRPPFLGVPLGNGGAGAIALYTRSGADRKPEAGIDKFFIAGYTPIRDFYSPDYAEQQQSYNQADIRRTLFWKPDIITDGYKNKIRIRFYNNDISHSIQVVLQGITEDGKLVHVSKLIK